MRNGSRRRLHTGAGINIVPPGIATLICIWFALKEHTSATTLRLDWIGFLALAIALACAQLIFDRGQQMDWFDSPAIVICTLVAVLAFWVFVMHCLTSREPFLDPRILLDRNFASERSSRLSSEC